MLVLLYNKGEILFNSGVYFMFLNKTPIQSIGAMPLYLLEKGSGVFHVAFSVVLNIYVPSFEGPTVESISAI